MGQSTDGIIAYGVPLVEGTNVDYSDDEDDTCQNRLAECFENLKDEDGASLLHHCSGAYPMHFLAVPGTYQYASRGYPEPINLRPIKDEEIKALEAFIDKWGLRDKVAGDMGWWLFSYWG